MNTGWGMEALTNDTIRGRLSALLLCVVVVYASVNPVLAEEPGETIRYD